MKKTSSKPNVKTPTKTPAKASAKTPAKTVSKAPTKMATKAPAKTPVMESSKVPSKAPAAKGKLAPKFKSKKLEERIAPGMIGSGLIDPGMADTGSTDTSASSGDTNSGELSGTQVGSESYGGTSGGNYIDEGTSYDGASYESSYDSDTDAQSDSDASLSDEQDEFYTESDATHVDEPAAWSEPDWVTANADGTYDVTPPEGVEIEDGIASFPPEVAVESMPFPEGTSFTATGDLSIPLPEGTEYNEMANALIVPADSIPAEHLPEGAYTTPDGNYNIPLPDTGCEVNTDTNTLTISNETLNEMAPSNVEFEADGTMNVTLPEDTQYHQDGDLTLSEDGAQWMNNPPADYYQELDYCEVEADGAITIEPPEYVEVEGGVATVDYDHIEDLPIPEGVEFHNDGSMSVQLPNSEALSWDADTHTLTASADYQCDFEPPADWAGHDNPDGSYSVYLPYGVDYQEGTLTFTNDAANSVLPDNMSYTSEGQMQFQLPPETQYYQDGSFQIPAEQTDFLAAQTPDYVSDFEFAEPLADGSYEITPPAFVEVDTDSGSLSFDCNHFNQEFAAYIPDDMTFHTDGTMSMVIPEATWDAQAGTLELPAGYVTPGDIPEGINYQWTTEGSVVVTLPDGIDYNAATQSLSFDNYWTNEVTPPYVEFSPSGEATMWLPPDTEYAADGSLTISADSAHFMETPCPDYMVGCDVAQWNPDGSYTVSPSADLQISPDQGLVSFDHEYAAEHFDAYIPDDVTFNADGSADVKVPDGTLYDANAGTLTVPAGEVSVHEIPEGINYVANGDGSLTVTLPEGINYDSATATLNVDNYWVNYWTPEPVSFTTDGQFHVEMPSDCHYYDNGSCWIPAESADFMNYPEPTYVTEGPDWAYMNPDHTISFETDGINGINVNPDAGTVSMTYPTVMEHFEAAIPEDMTFNADGSLDVKVPEGTTYNAATNSLTLPADDAHVHEIPEGINYTINNDGSVTVNLPDGISFQPDDMSVHVNNTWANTFAPDNVTISPSGMITVDMPPTTQYFDQGFTMDYPGAGSYYPDPDFYPAEGDAGDNKAA